MRINKINDLNFSGLWSIGKNKPIGFIESSGSKIFLREGIYHPFSDESQDATKKAMKNAKENMAYIQNLEDSCFLGNVIITKPILGERLSITEKQYNEISDMKNTPYYVEDQSAYYSLIKQIPSEIKKIIDEIG